jgi:uncharacterized NAD(P)/FAD-binding protein YdhS
MTGAPVVAIVGAGASGTLAAAHLAVAAAASGTPVGILLVDPGTPGTGLAYRSTDPRHRLNVPATGMSAWPDDPGHFLRWLRRHVAVEFPAGGFAPRLYYGQYLAGVLERAVQDSPGVRLEHLAVGAADLRRHGRRLRLTLSDGTSRPVDAAVLALGYGRPSSSWAPPALARSTRFVADPWADAAAPCVGRGDEVVLVGGGLTAVDMAQRWGSEGVRLHVVSRHGLLPLPHADTPAAPLPLSAAPLPRSLAAARRLVFDRIRAADGDWRRAVDGLRPVTAELWQGLDEPSRRTFLRTAGRRWDRVRHRVDPAVHEWLEQRRGDGSLVVHSATVAAAEPRDGHLRVTLTDGSVIRAAAVVNCTGAGTDVGTSDDPLVMNLLAAGLIRPGPLEFGVATDGTGRVDPAAGDRAAIWAIGPLRRGELWESTAVPEIRGQAAALARELLPALPHPRLPRRPRDPYGLPVSATPAAAGAYLDGLRRILRVQSGAEALIGQAVRDDPGFALGHAVLAVLGTEWGADVDVDAALAAAQSAGARADERERRFVEVAAARVHHPGAASAAALLSYLQTYPEDALAVSLAVPTIAFGGATEIPAEAWALVEGLAPAYGDDWWYLGLLAFTRQEQDRFAEAGELAGRSLAIEPAAGHAVHAKAHAHYETGDHRAGLAWLDRWIADCGAHASHRAHFSWHAALHELALGDDRAVARRYAVQLAPAEVTGVRALIDSASLLWRVRMADADPVHDVADVLRVVPPELLTEPPTPFVALHAALALAAVGDCQRLARLRRWARSRRTGPFADTIVALTDSLSDLVHGDVERAVDGLLALDGVDRLGGSAAQREIIQDTLLHCAVHTGRTELAAGILDDRLRRRESDRDRRRLRRLREPSPS